MTQRNLSDGSLQPEHPFVRPGSTALGFLLPSQPPEGTGSLLRTLTPPQGAPMTTTRQALHYLPAVGRLHRARAPPHKTAPTSHANHKS